MLHVSLYECEFKLWSVRLRFHHFHVNPHGLQDTITDVCPCPRHSLMHLIYHPITSFLPPWHQVYRPLYTKPGKCHTKFSTKLLPYQSAAFASCSIWYIRQLSLSKETYESTKCNIDLQMTETKLIYKVKTPPIRTVWSTYWPHS